VWVRQGGDGPASWLDGFHVRTIPFLGTGNFSVYESRSGQIWALFAGGVMEFRRDQWVQYPVPEIGAENQTSALRFLHPFPLLPAERDHVLALLPNRLLEYDAGQGRTLVLRKVEETRLGRFNELVEARDGGAWLAGSNGLAKLPAPVRRLTPDSIWRKSCLTRRGTSKTLSGPLRMTRAASPSSRIPCQRPAGWSFSSPGKAGGRRLQLRTKRGLPGAVQMGRSGS
jgi:sugar lactone lactonase YvrE